MFTIDKPLPSPTEDTEAYWDATRDGKLVVSTCGSCGHRFLPPARICPKCLGDHVSFQPVSGRGRVFSWIVVHRPQHPAFMEDAPYNVVIVELDEGPRMHGRLVPETDLSTIAVGSPVEVAFQKINDQITLPVFRAVTGT